MTVSNIIICICINPSSTAGLPYAYNVQGGTVDPVLKDDPIGHKRCGLSV